MKRFIYLIITCAMWFFSIRAYSQLTATSVQPIPANSNTGSITVKDLKSGNYLISYKRDGVLKDSADSVSVATTTYTINNLNNGVYSDITLNPMLGLLKYLI